MFVSSKNLQRFVVESVGCTGIISSIVYRLFLSRGADVNLKNRDGETPLDCCIINSKMWTILNTNKKLTDARRGRDGLRERLLCR